MPEKRYLVTPGPTPVPPEVLAATAAPMIHHRGPDFRATLARVIERLKQVFMTENDMLTFTSAGTGVMESAVANVCARGDRVLVVSHGYFGERFAAIAEVYGCDLVHLRYPWGESPNAEEVGEKLDEIGGAKAIFLTHSDTSTGVVSDLRAIAERLNGTDAIVVVDAISSICATHGARARTRTRSATRSTRSEARERSSSLIRTRQPAWSQISARSPSV